MIFRRSVTYTKRWSYFLQNVGLFSTSTNSPPRIAVVGSGPAGMFTCTSLLRKSPAFIDVFEYSPVPYGLVRYGVAPDHQEVKNCINGFDKLFINHSDRIKLFCNVRIGQDVTFDELIEKYDAIVLAYGSHRQRKLDVPGDTAKNVLSGSDFVAWYNGVPNAKTPLLDGKTALIIGNGNVALDCARIISLGILGKLNETDVPIEGLRLLEQSTIQRIKILGRRGPLNVSFTIKELREQFRVEGWESFIEAAAKDELESHNWPDPIDRKHQRLFEVLQKHVIKGNPSGPKQCEFLFHRVSKEIKTEQNGRVKELIVENTRTKQLESLPCDLLIYCLGYESMVLSGVPRNEKGRIAMSDYWRVAMPPGTETRVYATGWCAHGPQGVIVQTQQGSAAVAEAILQDFQHIQLDKQKSGAADLLKSRSVRYISWEKWKEIDEAEKERGKQKGKVREKFTAFDEEMTSLESKLLDGKNAGYCSSSEGEEETRGWKVAQNEDEHQANVMQRLGPSMNTGAKGVLHDFKEFREKVKREKESRDRAILKQARRGLLQGSKADREITNKSDSEEEETSLESLRAKRLAEMRKALAGRVIEVTDKTQYSDAIDSSSSYLLCVLIYEPDNENCDKISHICKVLAAEYPRVKFLRATSTILGMSKTFKEQALPTLQFYANGTLVGNFVQLISILGPDFTVDQLKTFLRKKHISLDKASYTTDTEYSTDEELD